MIGLRRLVAIGFAAGLAALTGCSGQGGGGGSGVQDPAEGILQDVGDMLREAAQTAGRPPAKLADLDRYQSLHARGYQAVKSGDVVVLWGAAMKGEGEAAKGGGEVIAYDKGVPADGGYVLLSSGEVKKMSASEFGSAPKAAGKK